MNKPIRILTATLVTIVVGAMCAYDTIHKNQPAYQTHPVVAILTDFFGASLSGFIFYFGSGWLARRKERNLKEAGDDKLYDEVARELQEKSMVAGLWTKAFAEMGGDDAKARALYIKYRVGQLRNKAALENERQKSEQARSKAETKRKVKEECLAAEAAKPPIPSYVKVANFLFAILCGLLTVLFITVIVVLLSDTRDAGSTADLVGGLGVLGGFTVIFGWLGYKSIKAALS